MLVCQCSSHPYRDVSIIAVVCNSSLCRANKSYIGEFIWDNFQVYNLKQIMRQKDDLDFTNVLNVVSMKAPKDELDDSNKALTESKVFDTNESLMNVL